MTKINNTPFIPSIKNESAGESIIEEILKQKPVGVKQLVHNRSSERELGPAKEAQSELDDLKVLLETEFAKPDDNISKKIGEYIKVWADVYNPEIINEKILVSLDQRDFADILCRVHLILENLAEETKNSCATLATKVAALEVDAQETRNDRPMDNIRAYSNLTGIAACAVLQKLEHPDAEVLFDKFLNNFSVHIKKSVQEDGSVFDFYNRDSLHYQIFNQIAWEKTLSFLDYLNIEVPNETRELVMKAREFCLENINSDKEHLEFVHSENNNDKALPGYGRPFDKKSFVCKQFLAQVEN